MPLTTLSQQFADGTYPKKCEGYYKGELLKLLPVSIAEKVGGFFSTFWLPWNGKVFYGEKPSGDNIIATTGAAFVRTLYPKTVGGKEFNGVHAFPFTTSRERGIKDPIDVLRLSYNLPENPKRLRAVIDEVVDIGNDTLLGKAFLKEGDEYRLGAYFRLHK